MATQLDYVVVIGASAGGLEALQELSSYLRPGSNGAFIVAQHLAPDHSSLLVDILGRSTQLIVKAAQKNSRLEPDQILVIPPNKDAKIEGSSLVLTDPEPRYGPSPSIDLLFNSLSRHWRERAVAVVLSGTGSDGAIGLRSVAAFGGLALVQSPESARFDAMPRAAIALGRCDMVADPATIGARLSSWITHQGELNQVDRSESETLLLNSILSRLKESAKIDIARYKDSTLRRQIYRRMSNLDCNSLGDYLQLLDSDINEVNFLIERLLVSVTGFFRDPDSFAALAEELKPLISRRIPSETLRVWAPGCATGEEAYSIGMTISQVMGHPADLSQHLKIFATDLDEQSLTLARRGEYSLTDTRSIPKSLLDHFVDQSSSIARIAKELRRCIVFSRHNLGEDPPFPRIDLISCRNTLIYFNALSQGKILDLFAFSLNPGGLLFLGGSESVGRDHGFKVVNGAHRIYERTLDHNSRSVITQATPVQRSTTSRRMHKAPLAINEIMPEQHVMLLEALLRSLCPCALVLDENQDLVEVIGDVSPYCRMPEGRMSISAGAYLRIELQSEAKALILRVRADCSAATSRSIHIKGREDAIHLAAVPLQVGDKRLTILSFISEGHKHTGLELDHTGEKRDAAFAREIQRLERELLSSEDTLRRSMADLEEANEQLEASTEELQTSSEELQALNEELEASIEELQATNEELTTLNQELRVRRDELEQLNVELENIQSSLNQGMVIIDCNFCVTRFSPLAVRVFGLVDQDIGQSIIDIPTTVPLPKLRSVLLAVISEGGRQSFETTNEDNSYLVQVMPYRSREGSCLGAIITLTDISEQFALRRVAESSLREFASLAGSLDQAVWKRDHKMNRFLYISHQIENITDWTPSMLVQNTELFETAIVAADREMVSAARDTNTSGWTVIYRLVRDDGMELALKEVATVVDASDDHYVVGTLTDVTSELLVAKNTHFLASGYTSLVANENMAAALVDESLCIVSVGIGFAKLLQQQPDTISGQHLQDLPLALEVTPNSDFEATAIAQPSADSPSIVKLVSSILHSKQPVEASTVTARLALSPYTLLYLTIVPVLEASRVEGVLLMLRSST